MNPFPAVQRKLFEAIERENIDAFRDALSNGADPRAPEPNNGSTPLMRAAWIDRPVFVKELLPLSKLFDQDNCGDTAIVYAAYRGHIDCLNLLLESATPQDINFADADGETPLIVAASTGHVDCVTALLPHSDANALDSESNTALMTAAQRGHADCVKALLPYTDLSIQNVDGYCALALAAANGRAECAKLLLPHSDTQQKGPNGLTPAELARTFADNEALAILIETYCLSQNERADLDRSLTRKNTPGNPIKL